MTSYEIFWTYERLGMQLITLYLLVRVIKYLRTLVRQSIVDRATREASIDDLKVAATELSVRTAQIANDVHLREQHARAAVAGQLATIDQKIDQNTEMTQAAARASVEAAEVANHLNQKIIDLALEQRKRP